MGIQNNLSSDERLKAYLFAQSYTQVAQILFVLFYQLLLQTNGLFDNLMSEMPFLMNFFKYCFLRTTAWFY